MEEEIKDEEIIEENKEVKHKKKVPIFKIIAMVILLVIIVGLSITLFLYNKKESDKVEETYKCLVKTTDILDEVADTIYNYWHDAVYKGKYLGNIDYALSLAQIINEDRNKQVIENNKELSSAVSELNDTFYKKINNDTFQALMDAYDSYKEYYEFTINVSGSFKSYSQDKENKKKEVRSYLSKLERKL